MSDSDSVPSSQHHLLRAFSFSIFTTMAIVVSYFPLYFDYQGYSKVEIGILYSIGPFVSIASNLIWGIASDRFHTIKRMLITILIGQIVALVAVGYTNSLYGMIAAMSLFYFFQTPVNPLTDSLTLLTVSKSGKSYASIRVFGSLGFAASAMFFGMVLKGQVAQHAVVLCLCTISVSLLFSFTLKDQQGSYRKMEFSNILKIIGQRKFIWFLVGILIVSVAHRMNEGFLALSLRQMGAGDEIIGWSWMASAISEIPVFFFLSKYGHKFKELPLLAVASLMYAIRFLLVSVVSDPGWVIAIQTMHSVSFGIYFFTSLRFLQLLIPDEYRATGQAVYTVVWSGIAGLLSGTIGGALLQLWGTVALYRCAMILALIGFVGFFAAQLWGKSKEDTTLGM